MSNNHINIDGKIFKKKPEPEPIVIRKDELQKDPSTLPSQYGSMSSKQKVIEEISGSQVKQNLLAGIIGGFIAWVVTEIGSDPSSRYTTVITLLLHSVFFGAMIGSAIGGVLGAADGITARVRKKAIRGGIIGVIIGFFGGIIGGVCGQLIYGYLGGGSSATHGDQIFARTLGWAFLGLFIGLAQGASGKTIKKVVNGLMGGVIGGAIGGIAFDMVGSIANTAVISRMFGITILGGITGAAIGMVEETRKKAWLKVTNGSQQGKQFIIYDKITRIGSSSTCEIALIDDLQVAPEHCRIIYNANSYIVECATGITVLVNDVSVNKACLRGGDILNIGQSSLIYEDKVTALTGKL